MENGAGVRASKFIFWGEFSNTERAWQNLRLRCKAATQGKLIFKNNRVGGSDAVRWADRGSKKKK